MAIEKGGRGVVTNSVRPWLGLQLLFKKCTEIG